MRPARPLRLAPVLLAALVAGSACGGSSPSPDASAADATDADLPLADLSGADVPAADDAPAPDTPPYPVPRPTRIPFDGQVLMGADLDGQVGPEWLVLDTGAVRTAIDATFLKDVKNGVGHWDVDLQDGIALSGYEVLAADLSTAEDYIGVPLAGLIGRDLFLKWWFGLDYRAGGASYVSETVPDGPPPAFPAASKTVLPWEEVQGYPVATVTLGAVPVRLIADTGSGVTLVVRSKVPDAVVAGGLSGYSWHTSYGSDPATIVRLPHLDVAGQDLQDTWAVVIPDQHHLKALFDMMNPKVDVDGFLGYPVYRRFFIGIRGADLAYDLWRCDGACGEEPADEWVRAGFEIRRDAGQVVVDMVFSPSDAAAKVQPGDALVKVGSVAVAGLPLDEVRAMLRGGAPRTAFLSIRRAGEPSDRTVEVAIEDLLPLSTP